MFKNLFGSRHAHTPDQLVDTLRSYKHPLTNDQQVYTAQVYTAHLYRCACGKCFWNVGLEKRKPFRIGFVAEE